METSYLYNCHKLEFSVCILASIPHQWYQIGYKHSKNMLKYEQADIETPHCIDADVPLPLLLSYNLIYRFLSNSYIILSVIGTSLAFQIVSTFETFYYDQTSETERQSLTTDGPLIRVEFNMGWSKLTNLC